MPKADRLRIDVRVLDTIFNSLSKDIENGVVDICPQGELHDTWLEVVSLWQKRHCLIAERDGLFESVRDDTSSSSKYCHTNYVLGCTNRQLMDAMGAYCMMTGYVDVYVN